MNSQFQENKGTYLLLLGLLFILLAVVFFMFLQPLMKESKAKSNEVQQLETEIAILEAEINAEETKENLVDDLESLRLSKRLPQNPEIEQLILTLEKIESISDSRLENISFSYDGSLPERVEDLQDLEDEIQGDTTENNEEGIVEEPLEEELNVIDMEDKPENLKIININMSVIAPDYDSFQTFVQEIEKQERMMMVSSMDFDKPGEEELIMTKNPLEYITIDVNIVTFYYDKQ